MNKYSQDKLLSDLSEMLNHIDALVRHLSNKQHLSNEDLKSLKQIIFHIDGLLVRLKNKQTSKLDLLTHDIIQSLLQTNMHLKKILLNKSDNPKNYSSSKDQNLSNHLFATLFNQLKKL